MAYSELGIKISADDKKFQDALKKIQADIAKISAKKLDIGDIKPLAGVDKVKAQLESVKLRYDNLFTKSTPNLSAIKSAENQIGSLKSKLDSLEPNRINQALGSIGGGFANLGTMMATVAATAATAGAVIATAAAVGFAALAKQGLEAGSALQQNAVAFRVLTKDAGIAKGLLQDLNKFADITPFDTSEVIKSGKVLLSYGVNAKDVTGTLQKIGDVAAGVGIPLDELTSIYGKARISQKLYAEDLNQLSDRGIPIFTELEKVLGLSTEQIRKLASEGQLGFDSLEKVFQNMTGAGGAFNGMMDEQSKTLNGLQSTVSSVFKKFTMSIAGISESGELISGGIADSISNALQQFSSPDAQAAINSLGTALGETFGAIFGGIDVKNINIVDVINSITEAVKSSNQFVRDFKSNLSGLFAGVAENPAITNTFQKINEGVITSKPFLDAFMTQLGTLSSWISTNLPSWIALIQQTWQTFANNAFVQDALGSIGDIITNVGAIISTIVSAWITTFDLLWNKLGLGPVVIDNIQTSITYFGGALYVAIKAIQATISWIKNWVNGINQAVQAISNLVTFVTTGFQTMSNIVSDTTNGISSAIGSLTAQIAGAGASIYNSAVSLGQSIVNGVIDGIRSIGDSIGSALSGFTSDIGGALGFQNGGIIPNYQAPQYFSSGGIVSGNRFGAKGTDTVPAWLTPGESVLKRSTTAILGADLIARLNSEPRDIKNELEAGRQVTNVNKTVNNTDSRVYNVVVNANNLLTNTQQNLFNLGNMIATAI